MTTSDSTPLHVLAARMQAKVAPHGAYVSDLLRPYTAEGYRTAKGAFLGTAGAVYVGEKR